MKKVVLVVALEETSGNNQSRSSSSGDIECHIFITSKNDGKFQAGSVLDRFDKTPVYLFKNILLIRLIFYHQLI